MAKGECTCWNDYPNEHCKNENGSWKCVDKYECVRQRVWKDFGNGIRRITRKTLCRVKGGGEC